MRLAVTYRFPIWRRDGSVRAYASVDFADAGIVRGHTWRLTGAYAGRDTGGKKLLLHRLIARPTDEQEVDHRNGDGLDNRRSNLRVCTHAENHQNLHSARGTSRFRGVSWDATRGKWRATCGLDYRHRHIGRFDSEEEAAEAIAAYRAEHMPFSLS